jgi:hypothetical protein
LRIISIGKICALYLDKQQSPKLYSLYPKAELPSLGEIKEGPDIGWTHRFQFGPVLSAGEIDFPHGGDSTHVSRLREELLLWLGSIPASKANEKDSSVIPLKTKLLSFAEKEEGK